MVKSLERASNILQRILKSESKMGLREIRDEYRRWTEVSHVLYNCRRWC
jgi:hypothetical protein